MGTRFYDTKTLWTMLLEGCSTAPKKEEVFYTCTDSAARRDATRAGWLAGDAHRKADEALLNENPVRSVPPDERTSPNSVTGVEAVVNEPSVLASDGCCSCDRGRFTTTGSGLIHCCARQDCFAAA